MSEKSRAHPQANGAASMEISLCNLALDSEALLFPHLLKGPLVLFSVYGSLPYHLQTRLPTRPPSLVPKVPTVNCLSSFPQPCEMPLQCQSHLYFLNMCSQCNALLSVQFKDLFSVPCSLDFWTCFLTLDTALLKLSSPELRRRYPNLVLFLPL